MNTEITARMKAPKKTSNKTTTYSTRLSEVLEARAKKAADGTQTEISDLVREGLARVSAEFERYGYVKFGNLALAHTERTKALRPKNRKAVAAGR